MKKKPAKPIEPLEAAPDRSAALAATPKLLSEIRLPEGDVLGIDIDYKTNTGQTKLWSKDWLSQGYAGVRIIGRGVDRTHLRSDGWDTIIATQHPGIVQFEELTVHNGQNRAVFFGLQNTAHIQPEPKFQFRFINAKMVADQPPPGSRRSGKWLIMAYNADGYLRDVTLEGYFLAEHPSYWHGFSKSGLLWERVTVDGAGAEPCKVRCDALETVWVPNAQVTLKDCTFKGWFQPWSDRGGAAVVLQGSGAHFLAERCVFWGGDTLDWIPANARSHCVMISSEGSSYDQVTGKVGVGFGNGFVTIRECAMQGRSDVDWNNTIVSVYRAGGAQQAARGVLIERCGIWGEKMLVQIGQVPAGKTVIRGCNSPELRDYCGALGMNVNTEALYPGAARRIPISEGIVR